MGKDLRTIYTAPTETAARGTLRGVRHQIGSASTRLWRDPWAEFIPLLDWDVEIRGVNCSTDPLESLNARYRRAVRARGHFPNNAATLKAPGLSHGPPGPTRRDKTPSATRRKPALKTHALPSEHESTDESPD